MGMYDSIEIKNVDNIPDGIYQTKNLDCRLVVYEIDGRSKLYIKDRGVYAESFKKARVKNANGYIYFYNEVDTYLVVLSKSKVVYSKKCSYSDVMCGSKLLVDPDTFILEEEE